MTAMHAVPRVARPGGELAPSRVALVADRFGTVMEALGLDLEDPNLNGTPLRVARAYAELFSGLPMDSWWRQLRQAWPSGETLADAKERYNDDFRP